MAKIAAIVLVLSALAACKSTSATNQAAVKDASPEAASGDGCSVTDETLTNRRDPNDSCTVTTTVGGAISGYCATGSVG